MFLINMFYKHKTKAVKAFIALLLSLIGFIIAGLILYSLACFQSKVMKEVEESWITELRE